MADQQVKIMEELTDKLTKSIVQPLSEMNENITSLTKHFDMLSKKTMKFDTLANALKLLVKSRDASSRGSSSGKSIDKELDNLTSNLEKSLSKYSKKIADSKALDEMENLFKTKTKQLKQLQREDRGILFSNKKLAEESSKLFFSTIGKFSSAIGLKGTSVAMQEKAALVKSQQQFRKEQISGIKDILGMTTKEEQPLVEDRPIDAKFKKAPIVKFDDEPAKDKIFFRQPENKIDITPKEKNLADKNSGIDQIQLFDKEKSLVVHDPISVNNNKILRSIADNVVSVKTLLMVQDEDEYMRRKVEPKKKEDAVVKSIIKDTIKTEEATPGLFSPANLLAFLPHVLLILGAAAVGAWLRKKVLELGDEYDKTRENLERETAQRAKAAEKFKEKEKIADVDVKNLFEGKTGEEVLEKIQTGEIKREDLSKEQAESIKKFVKEKRRHRETFEVEAADRQGKEAVGGRWVFTQKQEDQWQEDRKAEIKKAKEKFRKHRYGSENLKKEEDMLEQVISARASVSPDTIHSKWQKSIEDTSDQTLDNQKKTIEVLNDIKATNQITVQKLEEALNKPPVNVTTMLPDTNHFGMMGQSANDSQTSFQTIFNIE